MRLVDYLDKELIIPDFSASGKEEALSLLVGHVAAVFPQISQETALRVLLEREHLGTTGIGDGIAIPHGKLAGLPRLVVGVARSRDGIPFDALDQKDCTLFFLVLAPEGGAGLHLRILAHISRLARDPAFCRALLEAPDAAAMWSLLSGV